MQRIVLDPGMPEDTFHRYSYLKDWLLTAAIDQDPEADQPARVVSRDPKTSTVITYVDDQRIGLRYVLIDGKAEERIADDLYRSSEIKTISRDRIRQMLTKPKDREELILGLRHLAVVAPSSFEQESFDFFSRALNHRDPEVRHAAVQLISYPGWPEFKPKVQEMMLKDRHPDVREVAASLLRGYDQVEGTRERPRKAASGSIRRKTKKRT
jgi:hypothetical protein